MTALDNLDPALAPVSRAVRKRFLRAWAAAFARRKGIPKTFEPPRSSSRAGTWTGPAEEALTVRIRTALRALLPGPAVAPPARPPVLVSRAQIRELSARLEPGDLLLVRRERFLGEQGVDGFWDRYCLYVGRWRAVCPEDGPEPVGLVRAAAADHLAVLRRRPGAEWGGLTANETARIYDRFFGTERQPYDLVAYLRGDEDARRAVPSGVEDFRKSWRRPRWTPIAGAKGRKEG